MSGGLGVTAAVLTFDEQRHLPGCLETLTWADEVLVLDSGSTDDTVALAVAAGARVEHHPFENFARQRQRALELVTTPWVLFVDADERVPAELAEELRRVVDRAAAAGYWVPRWNVFWGRRMRGGGWWPDHQLRLLSVGRCHYDPDQDVHEVAIVDGPEDALLSPLEHLNYDSLAEFREKQADYARLEARRRRVAGQRVRPHNLVVQPAREFRRRFFGLRGWRDGPTGLVLCGLMAWYELVTLREVQRGESDA